jgi:hypothetical protein
MLPSFPNPTDFHIHPVLLVTMTDLSSRYSACMHWHLQLILSNYVAPISVTRNFRHNKMLSEIIFCLSHNTYYLAVTNEVAWCINVCNIIIVILYSSILLHYYTLHTIIQFHQNATIYFSLPFSQHVSASTGNHHVFYLAKTVTLYCTSLIQFTYNVL